MRARTFSALLITLVSNSRSKGKRREGGKEGVKQSQGEAGGGVGEGAVGGSGETFNYLTR